METRYSEEFIGKAELMMVGPATAQKILDNNYDGQRKIKDSVVKKYAAMMKSGNWPPAAGDFIRISKSGKLLNGQHRLSAVVEADMTIGFWVLSGVDERVFQYVDDGYNRNASSFLKCANANSVAALAKSVVSMKTNHTFYATLRGTDLIPRFEVVKYAEENTDTLLEIIRQAKRVRNSLTMGSEKTIATVLTLVRYKFGQNTMDAFVEEIANPKTVGMSNMIKLFSTKLLKRGTGSDNNTWLASTLYSVFLAWLNGKPRKCLNKQEKYLEELEKITSSFDGV